MDAASSVSLSSFVLCPLRLSLCVHRRSEVTVNNGHSVFTVIHLPLPASTYSQNPYENEKVKNGISSVHPNTPHLFMSLRGILIQTIVLSLTMLPVHPTLRNIRCHPRPSRRASTARGTLWPCLSSALSASSRKKPSATTCPTPSVSTRIPCHMHTARGHNGPCQEHPIAVRNIMLQSGGSQCSQGHQTCWTAACCHKT